LKFEVEGVDRRIGEYESKYFFILEPFGVFEVCEKLKMLKTVSPTICAAYGFVKNLSAVVMERSTRSKSGEQHDET
jgi:hypothetical protein